jgi:hypothetical protein
MKARIETASGWLFTGLGVTLLMASILVVPPNAFADSGCSASCGSFCDPSQGGDPNGTSCKSCLDLPSNCNFNSACEAGCCQYYCGGDPTCLAKCCQTYCGNDMSCQQSCAAQVAQKPCLIMSTTCEPKQTQPQCYYLKGTNLNRCAKAGDTGVDVLGNQYPINDPCQVTTNPKSCSGCVCRQLVVDGEYLEKCACLN